MTWREVLETHPHNSQYPHNSICGDCGNNGERTSEKNSRNQPREKHRKNNSSAYSHNSHNPQKLPSRAELVRIAGRAVAQFPDVRVDDVVSFLADAQDPAWCSERVATHIARRIHERQLWPEQWSAQA